MTIEKKPCAKSVRFFYAFACGDRGFAHPTRSQEFSELAERVGFAHPTWSQEFSELAERVGFEPTIPLRVCRISSAVTSTTRPPLQPSGPANVDGTSARPRARREWCPGAAAGQSLGDVDEGCKCQQTAPAGAQNPSNRQIRHDAAPRFGYHTVRLPASRSPLRTTSCPPPP
jgi:hypothetical protein